MPSAIEQIVDTNVRLGRQQALEDMLDHRRKLLADLRSQSGYDVSLPIQQLEDEVFAIEEGLNSFRATEATVESNSAQVSFMITKAQKERLRALGHDDDTIREMTPEQAHRLLGEID